MPLVINALGVDAMREPRQFQETRHAGLRPKRAWFDKACMHICLYVCVYRFARECVSFVHAQK